ncbi:hypothetical protein BJF95_11650 [Rhizobium oryziradicis]|uniref:Uncharacterized protein n=2 Tax=Rhizobium oryziradicis TaxID=1867956 RepID=A0A1Q8ZUQ2_9HYPH|nr:hypothetical protein BJF95_11650 [Rhizobium oryziradicis]
MDSLKQFIAPLGTSIVTVYIAFKWLGKSWIEHKFSAALQKSQAKHDEALEQVRMRMNAALDRQIKLYAWEFEILPGLWEKAVNAYSAVFDFLPPNHMHRFDLEGMTEEELAKELEQFPLAASQKEKLKNSTDRNNLLFEFMYPHRRQSVNAALGDFRDEIYKQGIFVNSDVREKLDSLFKILTRAKIEDEGNFDNKRLEPHREHLSAFSLQGGKARKSLEMAIRHTLWHSESN